ncbi:MAG TPA: hypothetical protein VLE20_13390, partial [Blastocatellia bacterium]|nr:hypothetical protein [Blastocatellia bacterium]
LDGLAQLCDIRRTAGIERVTDRRLLSARLPPEGSLHSRVRSHAGVDFNHSRATGENVGVLSVTRREIFA